MTATTDPRMPNRCLSLSRALFGIAASLLTLASVGWPLYLVSAFAAQHGLDRLDGMTLGDWSLVAGTVGVEVAVLILAALCWRGAGWRDPA